VSTGCYLSCVHVCSTGRLVGGLLASGLLSVNDFGPVKRWRKVRDSKESKESNNEYSC